MKKLYKMSMLVLVPIIVGVAMLIIGGATDNDTVTYIGSMVLSIGIPVVMFSLVVIGLILMMTGKLDKSEKDSESVSARDIEESEIEGINSSAYGENMMRTGEYYSRHLSDNYKHASFKEKILGWLFFGFLMTDFALIMVFAFLHIMIGALVCFCLFGGTILISLIVKVIIEKMSMSVKINKYKNQKIAQGEVRACLLSSTSSVGTNHRTRINKVTYRVLVEVDGKTYNAYTRNLYEEGDTVTVVIRSKRLASILDEDQQDIN